MAIGVPVVPLPADIRAYLGQKQRGIEQNDGVNAKEDFIVDVYVGINSNDEDAVSATHASVKWGKDGQLKGIELAKAMAIDPPTHSYLVDRTWQIDEADNTSKAKANEIWWQVRSYLYL